MTGTRKSNGAGRGEPLAPSEVFTALRAWREGLINLTGTNRALNFRHARSSTLDLVAPTAAEIFEGLRAGKSWSFQGEPDPDAEEPPGARGPYTLQSSKPDTDLGAVLRNLARRAKAEYLDRGVSVMYVGLGSLRWRDLDNTSFTSPLLLIPVVLVSDGPRERPRLRIGGDDATVNPALALRLAEFGITLPAVDDLSDISIHGLFGQVRSAVAGQSGWTVTEDVVLAPFSFLKEAMYRDLLANEAQIVEHPIVQALANQDPTSQPDTFLFDPIRPEDIDRDAPAEQAPLVLDADSSQRACVAAAVAGRSFVMDGPPGTGKSQTIANMIGALLHVGKTVLFVSEKAAALEVVRNRLADAGLENYLLELHSHKASRKEVAAQLALALDNVPVAPTGFMGEQGRKKVTEQRKRLNAYADAMNRIRQPLGATLHDVIGQISHLHHIPAAPTPDTPPVHLTAEVLAEVDDATARLERAWRPAAQRHSYLWREVTERSSLDQPLYQAETALEELHGVAAHNRDLTEAFELSTISDLLILMVLLERIPARPVGLCEDWLTTEDLAPVVAANSDLISHLHRIRETAEAVQAKAGVPWPTLPDTTFLPTPPALDHLLPAAVRLQDLNAAQARDLAERFSADADVLQDRLTALAGLASMLHLPKVTMSNDIDTFLMVADAAYAPHRPQRGWMSAEGLQQARVAATTLRDHVRDLATCESSARRYFTDAALSQPLAELHERFTNVHKGLRRLFGEYRRDKKTVAAFTAEMVSLEQAISDLGLAVDWSQANAALTQAEHEHAAALGAYWRGRDTDFDAIEQALSLTEQLLRDTPQQYLAAVTNHVTAEAPEPAVRAIVEQTQQELSRWRGTLAPEPAPAARPELLLEPLPKAITWLRDHVAPLHQAAARAEAVSQAVHRPLTLAEADALLDLRTAAAEAEDCLAKDGERLRAILGAPLFHGTQTNEAEVDRALSWAKDLRASRTGQDAPLNSAQAKALTTARQTDHLLPAYEQWQEAAERIVEAFSPARHAELRAELDDFDTAESLLADLRADSSGQEEWFAYQQARADLATHHLSPVIDFCIDQSVPAEHVGQVITRALLRAWVDHTISQDSDLLPLRAEDRAALVQEYQSLDRQLIPAATAEIIRAVNTRRPASTDVGEPALIRREGMKKKRHLPVRQLIRSTRATALAIKPCFMMSPLAVSQYLPPDMAFDLVIFDEASQVTPGDAINCIYRGKALITAGDDKQLPPTSFFDRMSDTEEDDTDVTDFQSILELSKASGAFRNLGLRWHYRSRHEDLIAFSNHMFYEGKLITYPGAHTDGPDVGVALLHVQGAYRRGTTRDNPAEAEKVAERVMHHFDTRPGTSLGVVTFSVAQADAIQRALDRVLETRPDLSRHFEDDRLNGFFIKSLESVQGDERDVIIFSVGYGRDEHGKLTANFGALNKPKGWRRLNVAITRARQRVEIVSTICSGDIPASENESIRYFAAYLDFAERGMDALALQIGPSGLGTESPFEDSVIDAIRAMGYTVEPQVGAAGYRIDIGVRHPAHPGVFALGVECDGYMYHSAPAARDRDRLREEVLKGLGWTLHRIWGTAWYRNRTEEVDRLRRAIETAIAAPVTGRLSGQTQRIKRPVVTTTEIERSSAPKWTVPYVTATVPPLPRWIDPSAPGSQFDMAPAIQQVVAIEGPVHVALLVERLREGWNIGRVGPRIREHINAAIWIADVQRHQDFLECPGQELAAVRIGLPRPVEHVPDVELRLALTNLVRDAGCVQADELMTACARVFGWSRRGAEISFRLEMVLLQLRKANALIEEPQGLRLNTE